MKRKQSCVSDNYFYRRLYKKLSKRNDSTPSEVRTEMQRTLFPNGKPSVEEFITVLSEHLKKQIRIISMQSRCWMSLFIHYRLFFILVKD